MRPFTTGFSGEAQVVTTFKGPPQPRRVGSARLLGIEKGSEGSVQAMTDEAPGTQEEGGTAEERAEVDTGVGRPATPATRSRMRSRRSTRDVGTGRLGTAASGLYREISCSEMLGSFSGAAGLLAALDTYPSFKEPRAARVPPSKRKALLESAKVSVQGLARVDSAAMYANRKRNTSSGPAITAGSFGSYRNLLVEMNEFEVSMVRKVEASSILQPDCGPEKAIDGRPDTRWASKTSAGSYLTIHLHNTCLLNEFRFTQATPESGGKPGEWASVVSLTFSDDSEQEFVVNASEEEGLEEQVFELKLTAAEWVRVMIKASHGNRGAAITDLQLFGYDACNHNLLVRQGERIQAALTAVLAGGSTATIWIAPGTYFEALEVMSPVTLIALTAQPTIICSLDPLRAAISCTVPGVYLHGLALLQAGAELSTASDAFSYDRYAPGERDSGWNMCVCSGIGGVSAGMWDAVCLEALGGLKQLANKLFLESKSMPL